MSEPMGSPPPPPAAPPPPPAAPAAGSNKNLMLALSYLWLLALIPLLVEKDDKEVQWHAKHGLVLLVCEVLIYVVITIISMALPFVGCLLSIGSLFLWIGFVVVHVVCIVKAINGERFKIPAISDFADKF